MTDTYFCNLDIQFPFMDKLYEELNSAIISNSWYFSPGRQCRSDTSHDLRNIIEDAVQLNLSDCGFFKNDPGWRYLLHKDARRTISINILMVDPCPDFEVWYYSDNFDRKILTPYDRDVPKLLNTQKYHSIANKSTTKTRYLLSIGHEGKSYEEVKKKFHNV